MAVHTTCLRVIPPEAWQQQDISSWWFSECDVWTSRISIIWQLSEMQVLSPIPDLLNQKLWDRPCSTWTNRSLTTCKNTWCFPLKFELLLSTSSHQKLVKDCSLSLPLHLLAGQAGEQSGFSCSWKPQTDSCLEGKLVWAKMRRNEDMCDSTCSTIHDDCSEEVSSIIGH